MGFNLQAAIEKRWKKPARVANDASVQGYGAIKGHGVELILTFGTGMGGAIFTDGKLCPGLELGHHPWKKGKTYEELLGRKALDKEGKKHWNKLLKKAIVQSEKLFNWDHLYLGGGNTKKIDFQASQERLHRLQRRRPIRRRSPLAGLTPGERAVICAFHGSSPTSQSTTCLAGKKGKALPPPGLIPFFALRGNTSYYSHKVR